jgi:hypothetical protein
MSAGEKADELRQEEYERLRVKRNKEDQVKKTQYAIWRKSNKIWVLSWITLSIIIDTIALTADGKNQIETFDTSFWIVIGTDFPILIWALISWGIAEWSRANRWEKIRIAKGFEK